MALLKHWLDELEDLFRLIGSDDRSPLCFLIGAGASLSSGAPGTAEIVAALMAAQPRTFPDPSAVYAEVHRLSRDDRRAITKRLFGKIVPHVGYRCLAAMARGRPIILINLNWDNCPVEACRRLGLLDNQVAAVNLEDTDVLAAELESLLARGKGLLSIHVHGRIEDPEERNPCFGTRETLSFKEHEFEQLQRLLNFRTFVIGTSLTGHHDVTELVEALRPPAGTADKDVKRLWVIERGPAARLPSPMTDAGHELTMALAARYSPLNFIAAPDVDFDMFMVTLRAAEVGFTWEHVKEQSEALLPDRSQLVPPNPAVVRPLLDAPGLLVGRSDVGKWGVAHQVAHWQAILAERVRPLLNAHGPAAILAAIKKVGKSSPPPVLVGDHWLGKEKPHPSPELVAELKALKGLPGVILTSRPAPWFDALVDDPSLGEAIKSIPFQMSQVWEERALKGYGRRQARTWASPASKRRSTGANSRLPGRSTAPSRAVSLSLMTAENHASSAVT